MKRLVLLSLILIMPLEVSAKHEISQEMLAIRKVYITGANSGQVEWAYEHFPESKGSCVKPVATPDEADAILRIDPLGSNDDRYDGPAWVRCSSSSHSTICTDSSGYESVTSCATNHAGNLNCRSSYGPSVGAAVADAVRDYARGTFVLTSLYTRDGKRRLWTDHGDTVWMHTWAYALSKAVGCVQQKCPVTHFKPCDTRWYDPSQLDKRGKLIHQP